MSLLDKILDRPKARGEYTFAIDPNDAIELRRLSSAADEAEGIAEAHPASKTAKSDAAKAKRAATAFAAKVPMATITYQAIGPAAVEALRLAHPPTEEQIEIERRNAAANGMNPDDVAIETNTATYPPALLAASLVSIQSEGEADITSLTEKQAAALFETLQRGDQVALFSGMEWLNLGSSHVASLGKG